MDQFDPDSTPNNDDPFEDDQDSIGVPTQQADLSLTKTVDQSNLTVGDTAIFTITVTNAGPDDATNVRVEDALPAGLNYVSSLATQGSYTTSTNLWTVGPIDATTSQTLTLAITVSSAGTFTNTAQVEQADQPDPDSVPDNNNPGEDDQDEAVVTIPANPGLEINKSVNIARVAPNQIITYTVRITNTGNVPLNPIVVTDTLEPGLTYVFGSANPAANQVNGQQLIWTDLTNGTPLTPQDSVEITLLAEVTTTIGTYRNFVSAEGDHPSGSGTDSDDVPVIAEDLKGKPTGEVTPWPAGPPPTCLSTISPPQMRPNGWQATNYPAQPCLSAT